MNDTMREYELTPDYDSRKSFYGKARVQTDLDGNLLLMSYTTHVASIMNSGLHAEVYGTYSQTTLRHIKEFLKQSGFKAESANQIMADYGPKDEFGVCGCPDNESLLVGEHCDECGQEVRAI